MSPILLLLIGMVIVVGSILIFRLHAFLALILGSLIVAALTDKEEVYHHCLKSEAVRVTGVIGKRVALKASKNQEIIPGSVFCFARMHPTVNLGKFPRVCSRCFHNQN